MLEKESIVAGEFLSGLVGKVATVVNIGSGDVFALKRKKPWVDANIFTSFRRTGAEVYNADMLQLEGVDWIINLTQPETLSIIQQTQAPRLIVFANVLEHLPFGEVGSIARNVLGAIGPDDYLLVTAPKQYPYHADPIDNKIRFSPEQLSNLFGLRVIQGTIVECGNFRDSYGKMRLAKKLRKLLKLFWPLQSFHKYRNNFENIIFYMKKKYLISIVLFRK